MRILLIKMSSMGDVFHMFPALTDAQQHIPSLQVDWVVEKGFADIPTWHPTVKRVLPIELRKWRKNLLHKQTRKEINAFFSQLNEVNYDLVIDAQGLLKSAWVARKVAAPKAGYNWKSAREPLASLAYDQKYSVAKNQHAITRLRQLLAQALGYEIAEQKMMSYGLNTSTWKRPANLVKQFNEADYWVFLHGTTWQTKLWPEEYWLDLLLKAAQQNKKVVLPWGNAEEKQRALKLQQQAHSKFSTKVDDGFIWVPEAMLSLNDMAKVLKKAQAVVSVDTGLSHVSAALEVPMVVLYRVTDPKLVGADGPRVTRLASPCAPKYLKKFDSQQQEIESLKGIEPNAVLSALRQQMQGVQ